MPTNEDLMGHGMNPNLAGLLGNSPNALTTTGTAQTTAAAILTHNTELVTAGSQTGAILPAGAKVGTPYFINNLAATTGIVYVPVGDALFGTANGSVNLAQNKAMIIWKTKTGVWAYLILA